MVAASAWLQSRQMMWLNRQRFLRDFARCQGWAFDVADTDISLDELFELIDADDETKEQLMTEFQKELTNDPFFKAFEQAIEENPDADIDALYEELERQYPDEVDRKPETVFVSPAVTVRRTAPNASKGVGRGTSGTGSKDPSDPDGDGDGDGDSSSLLDCVSRSLILWLRTDIKTNLPALCGAGKPNHCQIGGDTFDYPS